MKIVLKILPVLLLLATILQSQPVYGTNGKYASNENTMGESYTTGVDAVTYKATTFTVSNTCYLNNIELSLSKNGTPGTLTLQIRTTSGGVPTTTVIESTTRSSSDVITPYSAYAWYNFSFAGTTLLSSDTTYAMVLRGATHDSSNYISWHMNNAQYANGYYHYSQTGTSWSHDDTTHAVRFMLWGDTPSSSAVITLEASSVSYNSARLNGYLSSLGGAASMILDFDYGTTDSYGTNVDVSPDLTSEGSFYVDISGLTANTEYHFRATAHDSGGDVHGSDVTFTTSGEQIGYEGPTVTVNSPSNVTAFYFDMNGNIDDLGTASIVEVYWEWDTTGAFTNPHRSSHSYVTGTGAVTYRATGNAEYLLYPETTYYYRLVAIGDLTTTSETHTQATTSEDTAYGVTDEPTNITNNSATLNGKVYSAGANDAIDAYYEFGTDTNYGQVVAGFNQIVKADMFFGTHGEQYYIEPAEMIGLEVNTEYHYRLVLVPGTWVPAEYFLWLETSPAHWEWDLENKIDCNDITFSTNNSDLVIETHEVNDDDWNYIGTTTARLTGEITNYPLGDVVPVGFEYGTITGNLTDTSTTINMSGVGEYEIILTGLTPNTNYYFRAFAMLTVPIGPPSFTYGVEHAFRTHAANQTPTPLVTIDPEATLVITVGYEYVASYEGYDGGAIKLIGNLRNVGKFGRADVGFAWGIDKSYASQMFIETRYTTGRFEYIIEHLSPAVNYHFRAIAVGSNASLGADMSFVLGNCPTPTEPGGGGIKTPPQMATLPADDVGDTEVDLNGKITGLGNASLVLVGFDIGETTDYEMGFYSVGNANSATEYSLTMESLKINTTYHFRAEGIGSMSGYGDDMTFTTGNGGGNNRGEVMRGINDWLKSKGWGGQGAHWMIVIILMIACMALPLIFVPNKIAKGVLAVLLPMLVLGLAVASSFLDVWLVILIGIVVAAIVSVVVVRMIGGRH